VTPHEAAVWVLRCHERRGTLFLAGCGGFHAHACHIAAELVVRFKANRAPIAAVALGCNPAIVSAAVNDLGPESMFQREFLALVRPGDALMTYSTSGQSRPLLVLRMLDHQWHRVESQEDALRFDHQMCEALEAML
jgi:D-sedoheptulose 7-phosphate isomerase